MSETISACENVCRDFHWLAPLIEVLGNFGSFLVGLGVLFAYQQVNAWRNQLRDQKQIEAAEQILAEVLVADEAFSFVEAAFVKIPFDKSAVRERLSSSEGNLNSLLRAKVRTRVVLNDNEAVKLINELLQIKQRMWERAYPESVPPLRRLFHSTIFDDPRLMNNALFSSYFGEHPPYAAQRRRVLDELTDRLGKVIRMERDWTSK